MRLPSSVALGLALFVGNAAIGQNIFNAPQILEGTIHDARDIDRDGDLDLLSIVTSGNSNVRFLVNQGNGDLLPTPDFFIGTTVYSVYTMARMGDFNGDGLIDVIIPLTASLDIYAGVGPQQLGTATNVALPGRVIRMEVGEFNGTVGDDLAIITGESGNSQAFWIWHDGSQYQSSTQFVDGLGFNSLAVMDVDGDGFDDLAATNRDANPSQLRLLRTVSGVPTSFLDLTIGGTQSIYVDAADLDGDLDTDLFVAQDFPVTGFNLGITPILNQGFGSFLAGTQRTLDVFIPGTGSFSAEHLVVSDWDDDGDADVLTQTDGSGSDWELFLTIEDTGGQQYLQGTLETVFGLGRSVTVADFDADGNADFCGEKFVYYGNSSFANEIITGFQDDAEIRDFEGDGDLDGVTPNGLELNDGTGGLTAVPFTLPPVDDPGNIGLFYSYRVAVGDFDGDGFEDLIVQLWREHTFPTAIFVEMRFLKGSGSLAFTDTGPAADPVVLIPVAFPGTPHFTADVEGDNDLDIITPGGVWLNDGLGHFGSAPIGLLTGQAQDMADVDGDNDQDFLTLNGSSLVLQRNLGSLTFSSETILTDGTIGEGARFLHLDEDGDLDVAVPRPTGTPTNKGYFLLENLGSEVFAAPVFVAGTTIDGRVGAADIDQDGLTDFLAGEPDVLYYFRRVGPGLAFESHRRYVVFEADRFLDIDEDGDPDLVGTGNRKNRTIEGPDVGVVRQYGVGTPGTDSAIPILGASGPTRPGSQAALHVVRGVGLTFGLLAVGINETAIPDHPFPGATAYVDPWLFFRIIGLGGPAGIGGLGEFHFAFNVEPEFAGVTVYHQVYLADSNAMNNLSSTNGLQISYGQPLP
jgi:hypothetical protein